jgi:dTDP-4-dehydrorhamnose reductase
MAAVVSRWLVTGASGMLGRDVVTSLERGDELTLALTRNDVDITDEAAVTAAVLGFRPDLVVNCAAWTAVDDAETHKDQAFRVNGLGARLLAAACAAAGARLIHVSTDYVFGGDAMRPYAERDVCRPRTAYGRSKLAGEQAVAELLPGSGFIVRTAWLYGAHRPNFVRTMIRLEQDRETVDVVDDQRGQPTWTMDVARQIIALGRARPAAGVYHATSSGETTWFGFAREIFRLLGADPARVRPVASNAFPRPALRPAYSVLGHGAWAGAGIKPIPDWRSRLEQAFPALAVS